MSKIEGTAKKFDGTAIDYVSIFNWNDGKCIGQSTPNAAGNWSFLFYKNINVGITYVADGCEPITHGAYTFTGFFIPTDLFDDYNDGVWYQVSDTTTLYKESSGVTQVTADAQPVGLLKDKSGKDNHASSISSLTPLKYNDNGSLSTSATSSGLMTKDFGNPNSFFITMDVDISLGTGDARVIAGLQDSISSRYNLLLTENVSGGVDFFATFTDLTRIVQPLTIVEGRNIITMSFNNGLAVFRVNGVEVFSHQGAIGNLGGENNFLSLLNDFATRDRPARSSIFGLIAGNNATIENIELSEDFLSASPITLMSYKREAAVPNSVQGIDVFGGTAWVTTTSAGQELIKYNANTWAVWATVNIASITPSISPTSLGDCYLKDGILYIACGTYVSGGKAYIIEVDPDTLAYITHHDISALCKTGVNAIFWYNGYFYIGESALSAPSINASLYKFDSSFNLVAEVWQSTASQIVNFQGGCMVGDYAFFGNHGNGIAVFDMRGTPEMITTTFDKMLTDTQGISVYNNKIYVSNRPDDTSSEVVSYDISIKP